MNLALAAAHGQLGERDAAAGALRELLAAKPEFASRAREELSKWWNADFVEHLMDGLRKAGLDVRVEAVEAASAPAPGASAGAPGRKRRWWIAAAAAAVLLAAAVWIARARTGPGRQPEAASAPGAIRSIAVLPARQLLGRPEPGLLRRRDDRRADVGSREHQPASRDLPRLGDAVQRRAPAADPGDCQESSTSTRSWRARCFGPATRSGSPPS